jgi:hypothetical protein
MSGAIDSDEAVPVWIQDDMFRVSDTRLKDSRHKTAMSSAYLWTSRSTMSAP